MLGKEYNSFFYLDSKNKNMMYTDKNLFLEEELVKSKEEYLNVVEDNRNLKFDNNVQKLSQGEIIKLKTEGKEAYLNEVTKSSESFKEKTEFAQEKYVKRKSSKYFTTNFKEY
jgi:tRNA (adenine58-N1)-methyltransferase non-catalytic subunit